jgi:Ni,Fe-hydrogenase III component G
MSTEQIKELLAQLQEEIHKTELDDATRSLVRQLDTDIHSLLAADADQEEASSVVTRAKELEANFASDHPTAERFMREVIDVLVRMGI